MSKYLSKEIVLAAYRQLSRLNDKPSTQGQTQKTSILRYAVALDKFNIMHGHDCDTTNPVDKKAFIDYVGNIVSINHETYTTNFYKGLKTLDDYGVGSNFYSANVVPNSGLSPSQTFSFPTRGAAVFDVKNRMLLVESIRYGNFSSYLFDSSLRCAFAVWLMRFESFGSNADNTDFNEELRRVFAKNYSKELLEALWLNDTFTVDYISDRPIEAFQLNVLDLSNSDVLTIWNIPDGNFEIPHNLIFFGAPGTGKSYELNKRAAALFDKKNIRRVTFHPEYTYAQFVGCFKPYSKLIIDDETPASEIIDAPTTIEYRYVPGPFVQTYVEAITHPDGKYLLIIEEINRANPAAVFGDIFQLLDRDSNGASEYEIAVSQDLHDYLKIQAGPFLKDSFDNLFGTKRMSNPELIQATSTIKIPNNMFIWATMNSADQGVFPMDTAFKRRWDFEYMDINNNESIIDYALVRIGKTEFEAKWNQIRKGINYVLRNAKVSEDKWLGPFFIKKSSFADAKTFNRAFKDKVLLYLYEDAVKTKRSAVFQDGSKTYSELCADFDTNGLGIFKGFPEIELHKKEDVEEFEDEDLDGMQSSLLSDLE